LKDIGIITGSATQAKPLIIGTDTVYVHSNITPIEDGLFEYYEIQYTFDEYFKILAEQNEVLSNALDVLLSEVIPSLST